jgi:transposase InsO family protein
VILDGFSRKAIALKVYIDAPTMADMIDLMRSVVGETGKFRFIVTDHGCQFGTAFENAVEALGGNVVKGKVKNPKFNGKAEAFFKILKGWRRLRLLVPNMAALQMRLDIFREYFNTVRPKWGLKGRTPEQVWTGQALPTPKTYLQRNGVQVGFKVTRHNFKGDCALPVIKIQVIDPVKIIV